MNNGATTKLKNKGLKITPIRTELLSILERTAQPLDVKQLKKALKKSHIQADPVTVYRILDVFNEKGLIKRVEFQEGKFRYETNTSEHHHFVCDNCGTVKDISACPVSELEDDISRQQDVIIKRHSLEFFGLCHNCQ